jgi:uncharacterized protein YbjQ (UPF0145 family)
MLMSSSDELPGYRIVEVLGLVKGNTVRARDVGHDILARFKNMVGGEVFEYTKMLAECREQALDRMQDDAEGLGADAIVCVRFVTSEIMTGAAELLAYGTAVRVERI